MSQFSHFAIKKLYLKQSFNNISENLFSQINFDLTYVGRRGCPGVFGTGFVRRFISGGFSGVFMS